MLQKLNRSESQQSGCTNFSSSRWNGFLTLIEWSQRSHAQPGLDVADVWRAKPNHWRAITRPNASFRHASAPPS